MQLKQVFHSLAVVCITISVFIPVVFQAAALLAASVNPSHLFCISSGGFTLLPPSCNLKSIGERDHVAKNK